MVLEVSSGKAERVHVTGSIQPEHPSYCRHAIKALQFCFILKARTQCSIDGDTLQALKSYYAENEKGKLQWYKPRRKAEQTTEEGQPAAEVAVEEPVEAVCEAAAEVQPTPTEQPEKPRRTRRSSKKQVTGEVAA